MSKYLNGLLALGLILGAFVVSVPLKVDPSTGMFIASAAQARDAVDNDVGDDDDSGHHHGR
jgi:hypothetical protein